MQGNNILMTGGQSPADMDDPMRDADGFGDHPETRAAARPGVFKIFRTGQLVHRPPVTLDQPPQPVAYSHPPMPSISPDKTWESLTAATVDVARLEENGLFPDPEKCPASAQFDILRTRIRQVMEERGWKRLAITSPTIGCGKSFVAANLALSFARIPSCRIVLMDMDLRAPRLAETMGLSFGPLREVLDGDQPLESHFRKLGRNLALGLNGVAVPDAATVLHDPATDAALTAMLDHLDPTLMILDCPPALGTDDVIALMPQLDAVLIVADGTQTTAEDIRRCEALFEGRLPIMGVVLNRAQDRGLARYFRKRKG